MTDPQDDVPCRGCETEGPPARLDDDGMCRRCRVPHVDLADVIAGEAVNALREIATIIGCPANTDPLTDLDGLVMMVRGLAERAETVRVVTADAVAAERAAAAAWVREWDPRLGQIASHIEDGRHIDDDAPPLPSLRMTLLLRDELLRQVQTLTAERDRRIDPVEHARAVMGSFLKGFEQAPGGGRTVLGEDENSSPSWSAWLIYGRPALRFRGGADVLAEVER